MATSRASEGHGAAHQQRQASTSEPPAEEGFEKRKRRTERPPADIPPLRRERSSPRLAAVFCAGIILLTALVIAASFANRADYYIESADGAVEIWQGRFAPLGRERVHILPGAQPPPLPRAVYAEAQINAVIFNYYIDRADVLMEAPDMPDFNGTRVYLETALLYAVTDGMRQAARRRLHGVDMMLHLYKADIAASKGTLADFEKALAYMEQAKALDLEPAQSDLVAKKIQSIQELMADLRNRAGAAPPEASGSPPGRNHRQAQPPAPPK